tara:strand:- start:1642 stop:2217 length:576 start_codon:yes stop_codon:yes gene_type:complete
MNILLAMIGFMIATQTLIPAQSQIDEEPQYTTDNKLVLPSDFRLWPFLGSGLGMTYDSGPGVQSNSPELFTNVFVNPSSYVSFRKTGQWPDKTIFILEARQSSTDAKISGAGQFQSDLVALEAEVKDSRLPKKWGYFNFGLSSLAEPLSGEIEAGCIKCHTEHGAVERTFVQFYPTLLPIAREKGTLRAGF